MARANRWLWRGGLALGALALAWLAFRETPVEIDTATVTRRHLETVVEEEGRTRARDRYVLASPIAGTVARSMWEEGDRVEKGAVLARVYPTEQDPRSLEMAAAELAAAETRLAAAEVQVSEGSALADQTAREAERRRGLLDLGAISRESYERAVLSAETAARQAESARAAVRGAEAGVTAARVRTQTGGGSGSGEPIALVAPAAGTVLRVLEESERAVLPGTPLLELADVAGLELVVDVLSEDAVGITAGNRMRVTEWGGEGPLDGRVRLVQRNAFTKISALGVEEQRVDVIGDLPAAPASLGVGYRFVAQIVTWEGEVLAVPSSALFRSGDQWAVFQVEAGRVRLQEVQVGRRGVEFSEVSEGLAEGVEVVAFPSDQVADGVRVTTRGEG